MENEAYNIYCDESCHLENDHQKVMLVGCAWCSKGICGDYSNSIRSIQRKHNANGEIKWSKVSSSKEAFYLDLVDWFFSQPKLYFRTIVVLNKHEIRNDIFNDNSHDIFYYKMYFSLLSKILSPGSKYYIYLDVKDTRSRFKLKKLKEILCNNVHDFTNEMVSHIQNIHSHESSIMQLADLLMGAVSYRHRELDGNHAKLAIVKKIETITGRSLLYSTPLSELKFNIFGLTLKKGLQDAC